MKLASFLLIALLSPLSNGKILTIVADEWFPMNGEPNTSKPGYMIELAQAIFGQEGIDVKYILVPWERAVSQTREGKYDCVVGAYKTDTPDFIFPNSSWGVDVPKFFIPVKDTWQFNGDVESLKNRKLGVIEGYKYRDDFDEYVENSSGIHVQVAKGDHALDINIRKLMVKRIDTLVESEFVFNAKLKQQNIEGKFKSAGSIIDPVEMYIACSPNSSRSKQLTDTVDQYMPSMRKSGKLKQILDRYGLKDWQ